MMNMKQPGRLISGNNKIKLIRELSKHMLIYFLGIKSKSALFRLSSKKGNICCKISPMPIKMSDFLPNTLFGNNENGIFILTILSVFYFCLLTAQYVLDQYNTHLLPVQHYQFF